MLVLAIDTTTSYGSVAVVEGGKVRAEVNYVSPSSHSRQMFRAIEDGLKLCGKKPDELQGLAVAAGPGSFTGIRIGLSLVKALAMASGLKVASVSALEALARKLIIPGTELLAPLIDARKGEVFASVYMVEGEDLKELVPAGAYHPEAFLNMIPEEKRVHLIGTGLEIYGDMIFRKLGSRAIITNRSWYVAAEVGLIGEKYLEKGLGLHPSEVHPIYYRKSQAEEKKTGGRG